MKLILLKDIPSFGKKNEIKEVKPGFARNFLLPRGLAAKASPDKINLAKNQQEKQKIIHEKHEKRIDRISAALKNLEITIKAKATEEGHLFAGLHKNDIISHINKKAGVKLDEKKVILPEPIKKTGLCEVKIKLGEGKEFIVKIKIERL